MLWRACRRIVDVHDHDDHRSAVPSIFDATLPDHRLRRRRSIPTPHTASSGRPASRRPSRSVPTDPSCSTTSWCARCCATPDSRCRRASAWWCRASRRDRCGIASAQLLISLDAAEHQRLRRLVARAFTPRAADRMRAACVDGDQRTGRSGRRRRPLRLRRRRRQPLSDSDHLRAARGAPRGLATVLRLGGRHQQGVRRHRRRERSRPSWRRGTRSTAISRS